MIACLDPGRALRARRSPHARREAGLHAAQRRLLRHRLRGPLPRRGRRPCAGRLPDLRLDPRARDRRRRAAGREPRRTPTPWRRCSRSRRRRVDVRADGPLAPLQIMYTSGTTGDPKGIVGANFRFCAAGMLGGLFGYQPDERPYTGLSFTHGNAQSVTLAPALSHGAARRLQPALHEVEALGRVPRATAAPPSRSSAAWPRPSTASRSGPTTPTTRCAWW